ncbi:MCE family protein [Nocardioides sp. zg-DK7169]|uniref:MCE family protein n=1 Tax=Nocardioides sp. zg-DK7169 TaxID=2736600 RepID=UPI001C13215D|nr:MCE family protein [Nocardioides sp. zg-DK7169]
MSLLRRAVAPLVVAVLALAFALTILGGEETCTLTAKFPRAISIYEGSDVRVLGVPIGKVDSVTPSGTEVEVHIHYDADVSLPEDAQAVIVAPSVVGDRYIQITPVHDGGPVLEDGATLEVDSTATPIELDQIYASIDELTVALGPTGANADGALSDLLRTTAENFGGQGAQLNRTIRDFGELSQTLDDNKEELFGSAAELESFIGTLARNDTTVRRFNTSLAEVSTMLEGEREELSAALGNLSTALGRVSVFVRENRESLGRNVTGLNRVAKVLVKQRDALDEVLRAGPLALNNLFLAYNPQTGTLDTNANLGNLANEIVSDPGLLLCSFVAQVDKTGTLCDLIDSILPRPGALTKPGAAGAAREERVDPSFGGLVEVTR